MSEANMFNYLLPSSTQKLNLQNTFNITNKSDPQTILRNPQEFNMFDDLIPQSSRSFAGEKIYERTKDHELGVGEAFFLGLKDTYRGVKQMAGIDLQNMERDQQRIRELLENGDGLAKAAYFGGLILDPAMWLIPVLRGRNLYQMARSGAIAGGLAGAFGYVDDQSFFDTRTKQALGGAVTGGVLSPVIGKTAEFIKLKKLKKDFGLDQSGPSPEELAKLKQKDFVNIPLPGQEDIVIGQKSTLDTGKKVKGRGDISAQVRTDAAVSGKIKVPEEINDIPVTIPKEKQNNNSFLLRGPLEFMRDVRNTYSKNIGRPAFDYITTGKLGPELGGGLVGGAYGFSTEGLTGQALDPEDETNITKRFGRAVLGFMAGAGGILAVRNKNISNKFFSLADKLAAGQTVGVSNKVTQKWLDDPDLTIGGLLARGFVDGYKLPKEFKIIEAQSFKGLENMILIDAAKIAGKAAQLTPDENKVLYNMLEGDIKYDVPAKYLNEMRDEGRAKITELSQKYVDLGLITDETMKTNIEKYLRRSYAGQNIGKFADEIKARGIIENITPKQWINEYSKIKAYRFLEPKKPVAVDDHNGWELFGNILDSKGNVTGKKATVDEVKKLAKDPTKADEPIINARWQFTKQERLGMGEIENAGFAIAETGRLMATTLPRYDFYARLSEQPFTKDKLSREEALDLKYVKVPTTIQKGTIQPTFGKLAGKFVPEEVYFNLDQMNKIAEGPTTGFGKGYRKLNQIWKVSKTAWNPTVHVNNIISNLVLLDLVDGSYKYLPKAANAFMQAGRGKKSKIVELAEQHGVFNASLPEIELGRLRQPNIDKLSKIYTVDSKNNTAVQGLSIADKFFRGYVKPLVGSKFGLDNLTDWYRREDELFRLALFMDRIDKGYSAVLAAQDARKSFIDYNITAPAINWMRQFPTPFLAYTYRVIPILAETAFVRPWKYAKYAVLGYMLNNGGDILGGGDTKAERAAMPEQKQGRVFGLPFLPHRNVKIPLMGDKQGGAYMDITRYVPGGDILDLGSGNLMPGLPAPLQPNFGIAGDVLFPLVGFDLFGKKALAGQGISDFDDLKVRAKAVSQRIIPNFPFVPGSYSTQRIERARKGKETSFRSEESELVAFLNSVGLKFQKVNINKLRSAKGFEFQRKVNGIRQQISSEVSKFRDGKISKDKYEENIKELKDKFYDIRNSFKKALGIPLNLKEPTIISDIPKALSDAFKERVQEFGKDKDYDEYNQFDNLLPESSR